MRSLHIHHHHQYQYIYIYICIDRERERGIITSWGSRWYMYPSTALVTSRSSGPRHLHFLHNAGGHVWLHRCNPRGRHGDRGWVELVPLWSRVKRHSPNRWSLVIFFGVWHISHLINDWFEKWKDAIAYFFLHNFEKDAICWFPWKTWQIIHEYCCKACELLILIWG